MSLALLSILSRSLRSSRLGEKATGERAKLRGKL
jgi:hypothetical protein